MKSKEYGLKFYKQKLSDGYIVPFVTAVTDIGGDKSVLGLLEDLTIMNVRH